MNSPAINFLPWRLRGIAPAVVTFHDLRVPYLFPKANGLRGWVVRTMARRSAGCIATNAADLTRLQQWTDKPLRHIPIGSNIDAYDPNHVEIAEARDRRIELPRDGGGGFPRDADSVGVDHDDLRGTAFVGVCNRYASARGGQDADDDERRATPPAHRVALPTADGVADGDVPSIPSAASRSCRA